MESALQNNGQPKSCVIANPIYDTVFKKLMENDRIAKFFFKTLLGENIIFVNAHPQEFTYRKKADATGKKPEDETVGYSIFRIDFMATIEVKLPGFGSQQRTRRPVAFCGETYARQLCHSDRKNHR